MNAFPWPIFLTLLATGILCTLAVIPYSLALNPDVLEILKQKQAARSSPIPPALIVVFASLVQGGLLVAVALYLGLLASRAVGLGLPVLQAALSGQPFVEHLLTILPVSLLVGFAGGALILVIEQTVFRPRLPIQFRQAVVKSTRFWNRLLACFYGGIVEEILMRLLLFAGLAWLFGLVWKSPSGGPALGAFILANIISNVLFGLGHLPTTKRLTPLTPLVITRAVVLNSLIGLGCGFLFMAYGLEAAIIAHFSADIVIHLIGPAVLKDQATI
ncbi:MAG: CPBP family intramembrane metalloprotease [Chloroflexi bacterium]|nr:MAG: CPBP family intramembrane metalloprotease [Chloroflexota bacterium]